MGRQEVSIIDTGIANIASVRAAFRRLGVATSTVRDASEINDAMALVLPGVGSFAAAMERLATSGFVAPLRARLERRDPTLAICLGMQLLCAASEESPGVAGLGVIDDTVRAFPSDARTPQFGWNDVAPPRGSLLIEAGSAYFANSYRLVEAPDRWAASTTQYAGGFVSAIERDGVLACQFHPELSGAWGESLLRRWLSRVPEVSPC